MAEKKYFFLCLLHYNDTCKENQQFTGGEHRMVKLNILNMENFLDTVNACIGKVYMLCPSLILEIPNPTDYMNIISYYAGDC